MLDDKIRKRIAKDAVAHYRQVTAQTNSYVAGAEAEAERSSGLAKALQGMVDYWKWNIGDANFKEYVAAVEALSQYNKP